MSKNIIYHPEYQEFTKSVIPYSEVVSREFTSINNRIWIDVKNKTFCKLSIKDLNKKIEFFAKFDEVQSAIYLPEHHLYYDDK